MLRGLTYWPGNSACANGAETYVGNGVEIRVNPGPEPDDMDMYIFKANVFLKRVKINTHVVRCSVG